MKTSYRVIELVRKKISSDYISASDTDISRVLDVSRAVISAYKHEKTVMSLETLAKAQELLQMPQQEYFDLMLSLSAEGTTNPTLQDSWSKLHKLVRGALKGKAAAWTIGGAILTAGMIYASPENTALASVFLAMPSMHYTK